MSCDGVLAGLLTRVLSQPPMVVSTEETHPDLVARYAECETKVT